MTRRVPLVVLGILTVSGACAPRITRPAWRDEPAAGAGAPARQLRQTFAPSGEPARRYNDAAPPVPSSPVLAAVAGAVRDIATRDGRPVPVDDGRLYAVAAELAELLAEGPPPYDAIDFALSHHGIVEPSPHLLIVKMRGDDTAPVVAELRRRLPEAFAGTRFARLGVGLAPLPGAAASNVVVALQESALDTDPIPRELPPGGRFELSGRVLPPYGAATVYVASPRGTVAALPTRHAAGGRFQATIDCGDGPGKIKVEVEAPDGSGSPSVLANFAVWCGVRAPREMAIAAPEEAPVDVATAEQQIFDLANRERVAHGLAPLAWSDAGARIARAHSEDMRDHAFVAHVSPRTGTASDRARRGGLATPLLLENLARAFSPREAHNGLMNSPGHRANLLNPQATHLGVGVAFGDEAGDQRELYVTQLFSRVTPRIDPDDARRAALAAIADARRAARLAPVEEDPVLGEIAARYAAGLAAKEPDDKLAAAADRALDQHTDRFSQVVTTIAVTGDAAEAVKEIAAEPKARWVGVGVAQGRHVTMGEGALFVVVLLARSR